MAKKTGTVRVFVVMTAITAITLFFVWTRLQNIRLRREAVRLKEKEQQITLESNHLKVEWAKLTSPKRLEELGAQKYNLSRPRPEQVIVVKEPK